MGNRVAGKIVVVTAAGNGIGKASALMLAAEGAQVWATDVDDNALAKLKDEAPDGAHIETSRLDVLDNAAVLAFASRVGRIDALFNCAGYVHDGNILKCTEDQWDFGFDLNVKSMYRTIRAFVPAMLESGQGGSIINMASAASSVKGVPNRFVYGATKAAVIGLTKAVAADFITANVRCNAICPGTVESPSLNGRIASQAAQSGQDPAQVRAAFVARQPIGRVGRAEEIAALVTYLASDESSFTTGAIHVIDGGWSN
ncbi:SDR family oxidoreductase [Paraburkholderia xenovorans]|uniref:SDR family oxidoreductase n=1 Tax=Paraburkholderia xenovorans TaxID=36873 RepID=UPI0038BCB18F